MLHLTWSSRIINGSVSTILVRHFVSPLKKEGQERELHLSLIDGARSSSFSLKTMQSDSEHITLVIADDHPIVLRGLREAIEDHAELLILGEAMDGDMALMLIRQHQPQVAILDVVMPGLSGIEVTRMANKEALDTAIIILTVYDDYDVFHQAIDAGAMGYILKDCMVFEIIRGIKRVAMGDFFISPDLTNKLVKSTCALDNKIERLKGISLLTVCERRILHLIAMDKSTKEIAEELAVSPKTIISHRTHISTKLHLSGSFSLLRFALENREYI